MNMRFYFGLGLAAALLAAPALAQEELSAPGQPEAVPAFGADELAAILTPAPATRSLVPGSGPEPGTPGSGVLPDLKVHFDFDSAALTPEATAQLDELGQVLQREALRAYRFRISGHTDAVGSEEYNERLSQLRASAVTAYLADQHEVERDRLEAIGMGERELIDPDDPRNWANRRVEVRTVQ
jgi:outer membrane protein OmpA-like peptidoglycan-associated protein